MPIKNKIKKGGFTLIELLVVISIIGLLSSIVLASLSTAKMKARDTRRISDLHQIRLALELYYNANNSYPGVSSSGEGVRTSDGWLYSTDTTWDTSSLLQIALIPYLAKLPKDPINNLAGPWSTGSYSYSYGYNPQNYPGKYDLVAQLENTSSNLRCEIKKYLYHTVGAESVWCGSYSNYLYADD